MLVASPHPKEHQVVAALLAGRGRTTVARETVSGSSEYDPLELVAPLQPVCPEDTEMQVCAKTGLQS